MIRPDGTTALVLLVLVVAFLCTTVAIVDGARIDAGFVRYLHRKVSAAASYYARGSVESHPGILLGCGVETLTGLPEFSRVTEEDLTSLLHGFHPRTGEALVRNAGSDRRKSTGWTWDSRKEFSAAYAVIRDPAERVLYADAFAEAGVSVLRDVFQHRIQTRRGEGGHNYERADKVAFAVFVHDDSRGAVGGDPEPQLHLHVVLPNVCERQDGTTGALHLRNVFRSVGEFDRLFAIELGSRLAPWRDLIERVPESLNDKWSSSQKRILAAVGEDATEKERQIAAWNTRPPKQPDLGEEKFARWREEALRHGFSQDVALRQDREVEHTDNDEVELEQREPEFSRDLDDDLFPDLNSEELARFASPPPEKHYALKPAQKLAEERRLNVEAGRSADDIPFAELSLAERRRFQSDEAPETKERVRDGGISTFERLRQAAVYNLTAGLAHQLAPSTIARYGIYSLKNPFHDRARWETETLREKASRMLAPSTLLKNLSVVGNLPSLEEMRKAARANLTTRFVNSLAPDSLLRDGLRDSRRASHQPYRFEQETLSERASRLLSRQNLVANLTLQPLRDALVHNLTFQTILTGQTAREMLEKTRWEKARTERFRQQREEREREFASEQRLDDDLKLTHERFTHGR